MSVTRFGVSLLNVVATIDRPPSHHGTARPDAKNSDVLRPARRPKNSAGAKQITSVAPTISQSRNERVMSTEPTESAKPTDQMPACAGDRPPTEACPRPSEFDA